MGMLLKKDKNGEDYIDADVEIIPTKKPYFDFDNDPDIEVHEYGSPRNKQRTIRGRIVNHSKVTPLGYKLIRLALTGKSWVKMKKITGIGDQNLHHMFNFNPVIRAAVADLEKEIVEDSNHLLIRKSRAVTRQLIRMALGQAEGTANHQKVQLEAIREYYNRLGFGAGYTGAGRRGEVGGRGDMTITISEDDSKDLALLVARRERSKKNKQRAALAEPETELDSAVDEFEGEVLRGDYEDEEATTSWDNGDRPERSGRAEPTVPAADD